MILLVKQNFPSLDEHTAKITSPQTPHYNCIAYAAGDQTKWWWPDPTYVGYWPSNCVRNVTLQAFQLAFESLGYNLCADGSLEDGYQKIAIYHLNNQPTHAARQLEDGLWSSKLGNSFDISHTEGCLNGANYGQIAFFMRKPKPVA